MKGRESMAHLTQFLVWLQVLCEHVLSVVSSEILMLALVLFCFMVIARFAALEKPLNHINVPQPAANTQLRGGTETVSAPSTDPRTKYLISVPNGTKQLLDIPLAQIPITSQLPASPFAQTTAQSSMLTFPHDTQPTPSSSNDMGSDSRRIVSSVSSAPSASSRLFASAIPSSSASSVYSMLSALLMSSGANTVVENTGPSAESHQSTTPASLVPEFDSVMSTLDTDSIDRAVNGTNAQPAHRPSMQCVSSPAFGTSPNTSLQLPWPTPASTSQLLNRPNTQHPTPNPAIQRFVGEDGPWSSENLYVSDRRDAIGRTLENCSALLP